MVRAEPFIVNPANLEQDGPHKAGHDGVMKSRLLNFVIARFMRATHPSNNLTRQGMNARLQFMRQSLIDHAVLGHAGLACKLRRRDAKPEMALA